MQISMHHRYAYGKTGSGPAQGALGRICRAFLESIAAILAEEVSELKAKRGIT